MLLKQLLESSDKMMMLGDMKAVADKLAKCSGLKFKQAGASFTAKTGGEKKEAFGMRCVEGNKDLKAVAAEGNSEYDRWNVKMPSGIVHIYAAYDGEVRVTHEDADMLLDESVSPSPEGVYKSFQDHQKTELDAIRHKHPKATDAAGLKFANACLQLFKPYLKQTLKMSDSEMAEWISGNREELIDLMDKDHATT